MHSPSMQTVTKPWGPAAGPACCPSSCPIICVLLSHFRVAHLFHLSCCFPGTPAPPVHLLPHRVLTAEIGTCHFPSPRSPEETVRAPEGGRGWTRRVGNRRPPPPPPPPSPGSCPVRPICVWSMRHSSTGSVAPSRRWSVPPAPSWGAARATLWPPWLTESPQ